jgi:hypothetical protein
MEQGEPIVMDPLERDFLYTGHVIRNNAWYNTLSK